MNEVGQVECDHCFRFWDTVSIGGACLELMGDNIAQERCLKFQGWTKRDESQGWTRWETFWWCPHCSVHHGRVSETIAPSSLRCPHRDVTVLQVTVGSGSAGSAGSGGSCGGGGSAEPLPKRRRVQWRLAAVAAAEAAAGSGGSSAPPPPPPPPPPPTPPPPPSPMPHCSLHCQGCLRVCMSCLPLHIVIASPFVDRLRNLTIKLNALPSHCMPDFLLNPVHCMPDIRALAQTLPEAMRHGNLAGSALILALLRPHLYTDDPLPLRLFGYPPPLPLLAIDMNPHSGGGPDNDRNNIAEALCAHWHFLDIDSLETTLLTGQATLLAFQEAWCLMRIKVDLALRHRPLHRPNGHQVFMSALQMKDDAMMP